MYQDVQMVNTQQEAWKEFDPVPADLGTQLTNNFGTNPDSKQTRTSSYSPTRGTRGSSMMPFNKRERSAPYDTLQMEALNQAHQELREEDVYVDLAPRQEK